MGDGHISGMVHLLEDQEPEVIRLRELRGMDVKPGQSLGGDGYSGFDYAG